MKIKRYIIVSVFILLTTRVFAQSTFLNSGADIIVTGSGSSTMPATLYILGDFENKNDGINNGSIDLNNSGHIYLTGNWNNNSFGNVFLPSSSSLTDGIVTMFGNSLNQSIGGSNPTFFENLKLIGSRKILLNNNNSVNKTLSLDAPLILNSNLFEIKNSNPNAIDYISGFIKSETLPGSEGYLKWDTKSEIGTFAVPFGNDDASATKNLELSVTLKQPMNNSDYFIFSTYPSDVFNMPLPTGASNLEINVDSISDRYWNIQPSDKNNLSPIDIKFSYADVDIATPNTIIADKLLASRNNTDVGKWLDMTPRGDANQNTVTISNVLKTEFYPTWTLVNNETPTGEIVYVPDGFSPNGDGLNDVFIPVFNPNFVIKNYSLLIFNRWGEVIFKTTDPLQGWDGRVQGKGGEPFMDVYSWVIIVNGNFIPVPTTGLIKKRIVGKIALIM